MRAHKKEFKGPNGDVIMAVFWVTASPTDPIELYTAYGKLGNYISQYVGRRGHNIYMHTQGDTVAAVVTFDLNQFGGQDFDLP